MSEHLGPLLSAHLDGELTPAELLKLNEHLPKCEPCRAEMDGLHAARAALRSLPLIEVPDFGQAPKVAPVIPIHRLRRLVAAAAAVFVAFVGVATYQASVPVMVSLSEVTETQFDLDFNTPSLIPQVPAGSQ